MHLHGYLIARIHLYHYCQTNSVKKKKKKGFSNSRVVYRPAARTLPDYSQIAGGTLHLGSWCFFSATTTGGQEVRLVEIQSENRRGKRS